MKTAVYAGSFNPWHKGHQDVLDKTCQIFDKVVIAIGDNNQKHNSMMTAFKTEEFLKKKFKNNKEIKVERFRGLLVDYIAQREFDAIIRGLRNGYDLQYEQNMQYWNEDLGVTIPTVFFITDRKYGHVSSSSIREINSHGKKV